MKTKYIWAACKQVHLSCRMSIFPEINRPVIIIIIISIQPEGKSATWETALLPPQGRHAVDFFARKIRDLGYQRPAC